MFITLFFLYRPKQFYLSFFNQIVAKSAQCAPIGLKIYKNPQTCYNYPSVVGVIPPSPDLNTSNSTSISRRTVM